MTAGLDPARVKPRTSPLPDALGDMRARMQRNGQWLPQQMAGRRWPVACVSLEITQRCNLDCTLCYLSESAEAVRDFPLDEVFRRIDMILAHYGPGTDVQVSGGEPTLRRRDELVAIVRRLASLGLRATLFTNGIKATRDLLAELCEAGLTDVAFHVDTTQQRAGYATEQDLNALRSQYIERARGLPLSVFFNTTVHAGNFDEVPMLTAWFLAHADGVRFASFQLQADTGRGVLGARSGQIGNLSVAQRLRQGAGVAELGFNVLSAGHHECSQCAVLLVMRSLMVAALSRPALSVAALRWALALAWRMRRSLLAGRGRVHKLTLFTHNFMDACSLDAKRIDACVFMAITQDGPLSMCAYNAQRDSYLLRPLQTAQGRWQPLRTGHDATPGAAVPTFPIKWLKGRPRAAALQSRQARALRSEAGVSP
jgi:uncharacterized radical SAM superfamily Fe-S cluster-containing enzyme